MCNKEHNSTKNYTNLQWNVKKIFGQLVGNFCSADFFSFQDGLMKSFLKTLQVALEINKYIKCSMKFVYTMERWSRILCCTVQRHWQTHIVACSGIWLLFIDDYLYFYALLHSAERHFDWSYYYKLVFWSMHTWYNQLAG